MANIKGSDTLKASIKTINPQVAKILLDTAKRNRRISRNRVLRLSQAMRLGEWVVAQPLMVNCDGTLIDGQHRLQAVVHSGKPVEFLVIEGYAPEKTFAKVDDTSPRSLKDWLEIRGEPLPQVMAAVVLMDAKHDAGFCPVMAGGVQFRLTGAEGLGYYDAHPEIKQAVLTAPATVSRLAPRSFLVYCFLKFSGKDEQHARNFLIDLTNGESTGQGDPVELLRNRLLENRASKSKLKKKELLALIIKAWNFDRSGERPDNLRWISSGPRAESFPEVQ